MTMNTDIENEYNSNCISCYRCPDLPEDRGHVVVTRQLMTTNTDVENEYNSISRYRCPDITEDRNHIIVTCQLMTTNTDVENQYNSNSISRYRCPDLTEDRGHVIVTRRLMTMNTDVENQYNSNSISLYRCPDLTEDRGHVVVTRQLMTTNTDVESEEEVKRNINSDQEGKIVKENWFFCTQGIIWAESWHNHKGWDQPVHPYTAAQTDHRLCCLLIIPLLSIYPKFQDPRNFYSRDALAEMACLTMSLTWSQNFDGIFLITWLIIMLQYKCSSN